MARAWVRTGTAGLLACAVFAGIGNSASGQRQDRSRARAHAPAELLREYPFVQGRLRSRQRPATQRPRTRRTHHAVVHPIGRSGADSGNASSGWPILWLALGGVVLLGVLGLIARRALRPRAAGASSPQPTARTAGSQQPVPDAEPTQRPAVAAGASSPQPTARTAASQQPVPDAEPTQRPAVARPSARFARRARPSPPGNCYAVANQKGGVGKTTVSLTLGAAAARRGKRVLLVDLDPQASATAVLGADADDQASIADVLVDGSRALREIVVPTAWGLDLVPAEPRLRSVDTGARRVDESVFGRELATLADYDLVLIDCPPSLGGLTLEALNAVSRVLVVIEPTYLALHAMKELRDTLDLVADAQNPALELAGVVLNRVEPTAEYKRSVAELEADFGPRVWTPYVPKRGILQDAMRLGVPPHDLTTHGKYVTEIGEIFDRLVERFATMKFEPSRRFSASGVETVEPSEESQALDKVRAYYEHKYGPMSPEESRELLRRFVERTSHWTIAELNALEHAGLAYGDIVPRPADAPTRWPRGPTALGERTYRRMRAADESHREADVAD